MMRSALKIGAIAVVLFLAAQEANAYGHRHGGGWCGAGGCGGGGCGYGGGYGGYGWGYGGWYGGYNGYGWGYGGYRTSLGYLANIAAPTTSARVASTANNSATLTVSVPADARIFVNDQATKTTGANRSYVSRNLQPGARYTYRVRAEFTRDGRQVSQVKTVQLSAGQNQSLAFGSGPQPPTASATAALR